MSVRVRLAPSPTGNLHIGTARTALFNWLFAYSKKGKFLIRIEDTDKERSKKEFTKNILEGLKWLGLSWNDDPVIQSESLEKHKSAIQKLLNNGLAYRCYANESELELMREKQKELGSAPKYDNRHRNLTLKEQESFQADGREAVIRFKIDNNHLIQWEDMVRGPMIWKGSDLGGDMVIARRAPANEIGDPLYNLVVVVDDNEMQISHVIRGEDHIANTAKQILLYKALQIPIPIFAHTPLILNGEGRKLSKRDGVTSINQFQDKGYTAEAMSNYMALLGWSAPEETNEILKLEEIGELFSFKRVNKAGAKFDWDKLNWINSQVLHNLSEEDLLEKLTPLWLNQNWKIRNKGWCLELVKLIAPSLILLTDGIQQAKPFFEDISIKEDGINQLNKEKAKESLGLLLNKLEESPWDGKEIETAKTILKETANSIGVKKGLLMQSLRAALLGEMNGPDLLTSWSLLAQAGKDLERLRACL